jgi:hypothetical protein
LERELAATHSERAPYPDASRTLLPRQRSSS